MRERFLGRGQGKGSTVLCGAGKLGHTGPQKPSETSTAMHWSGSSCTLSDGRKKDPSLAGGTR